MKINTQDIMDWLAEDCDNVIVDDFAKLIKNIAPKGVVEIDNVEFQLLLKDFLEAHENNYQYDLILNILDTYYDKNKYSQTELEEEVFGPSNAVIADSVNKGLYTESDKGFRGTKTIYVCKVSDKTGKVGYLAGDEDTRDYWLVDSIDQATVLDKNTTGEENAMKHRAELCGLTFIGVVPVEQTTVDAPEGDKRYGNYYGISTYKELKESKGYEITFEEIINKIENAVDYVEMEEITKLIEVDDVRVDVLEILNKCIDNKEDIKTTSSLIINCLNEVRDELNESKVTITDQGKAVITGLNGYASRIRKASGANVEGETTNTGSSAKLTVTGKGVEKVNAISEIEKINKELEPKGVKFDIDYKDNGDIEANINTLTEAEEIEEEEPVTIVDLLQDRIGEKLTIGEFNTLLQSVFGKYNETFLLASDLYNLDPLEMQTVIVYDEEDIYTIKYEIIDLDDQVIAMTDVVIE